MAPAVHANHDKIRGLTVIGKLRRRLAAALVVQAARMLPTVQRRKLLLLVLVQVFLGTLDLISVGLVGLLGTLAVTGVQSQRIGNTGTIHQVLSTLHLDSSSTQSQIAVLAIVTCAIFLARTAASIYLSRRALHFLGIRSAEVAADLVERLLEQPITFLQSRTMQDLIYAVTTSTNALVLGVLGTVVMMAADASMLLAIAVMLLYVSPLVAVAAGALLGVLVGILHRFTTSLAQDLGRRGAQLDIASRDLLTEALSTYRDMQVRGSRRLYEHQIREYRLQSALISADGVFLPNISKYVLETGVILGALLVGSLEFALENAQRAVGVLALFLAAGTRLAPAIVRLQQSATFLRWNLGQAHTALALFRDLGEPKSPMTESAKFTTSHDGFNATLTATGVTFKYPGAQTPALSDFNLHVSEGELVAFVGPSGAGKSTAVDLLLGVLHPDVGEIRVGGIPTHLGLQRWPGAVGYVPQDVWIAEGSIRKNVALGFAPDAVPDADIWAALQLAQMEDVVASMPEGLDSLVGERGVKLSGGQRQRLGIARTLLTRPRLVILDEATSALDAETEHRITAALQSLRGHVTLVVIAHRLAVVRDAEQVLYFDGGRVTARGSFEFVRGAVPDFDRQAQLLGL